MNKTTFNNVRQPRVWNPPINKENLPRPVFEPLKLKPHPHQERIDAFRAIPSLYK